MRQSDDELSRRSWFRGAAAGVAAIGTIYGVNGCFNRLQTHIRDQNNEHYGLAAESLKRIVDQAYPGFSKTGQLPNLETDLLSLVKQSHKALSTYG